jgi:hypothetical protein
VSHPLPPPHPRKIPKLQFRKVKVSPTDAANLLQTVPPSYCLGTGLEGEKSGTQSSAPASPAPRWSKRARGPNPTLRAPTSAPAQAGGEEGGK